MMAAWIGRGHRPFCSGGRCGSGAWALGCGVVHISAKVERQRGEHQQAELEAPKNYREHEHSRPDNPTLSGARGSDRVRFVHINPLTAQVRDTSLVEEIGRLSRRACNNV